MNGGFAALMATIILGARVGRFSSESHIRDFKGGHNPPLYLLGTLLLWLGWCVQTTLTVRFAIELFGFMCCNVFPRLPLSLMLRLMYVTSCLAL